MRYKISYAYNSKEENNIKALYKFANIINDIFANDIDPIRITHATRIAIRREISKQIESNLSDGKMMKVVNGKSNFIDLIDSPQFSSYNPGIICPIIKFEIKYNNSSIVIGIMVEYNKSSRKSDVSTYIFNNDFDIPDDIKNFEDISKYYIEDRKKNVDCINPIADLFIKNQCYFSHVAFNSVEDD